jgi:GxxExxY protein
MEHPSRQGYDFGTLTEKIIGAAIEVHKRLGAGFQEVIYQRALGVELAMLNLEFQREVDIPVYYRGEQVGIRRVDFVVEDCLVEIKARSTFQPEDYVQALSYIKASGYRVGLLLNFGAGKVEIKRLVNDHPHHHPDQQRNL